MVSGGISRDRHATRWWPWAVRAGGPIDPDRVRVLAFDLAPGLGEAVLTVTTTDAAGQVRFINQAACVITGWTSAAATGRRIDEVCALRHEKTGAAVMPPVFTYSPATESCFERLLDEHRQREATWAEKLAQLAKMREALGDA